MFLCRIFKGKKTKPVEKKTAAGRNSSSGNGQKNNKENKSNNGAANIPISGDKTRPDYSDYDESLTLNSGTTQDDPQYRGLYRHQRGMSSNDASFAGATLGGESAGATLGGESSFRSYSDNSSLSTSNTATNEWDKNLGRNNNDGGDNNNQNQHQILQITGLPKFHDDDRNDDANANDDDARLLFLDEQQQKFNNNIEDSSSINAIMVDVTLPAGGNAIIVDVTLPAGKVGIVLNTPEDDGDVYGAPTVYQVKETCPVYDQVQVGDRLIAVDGQDCTHLTALQVSRILSSKANQPKRLLTLARRV